MGIQVFFQALGTVAHIHLPLPITPSFALRDSPIANLVNLPPPLLLPKNKTTSPAHSPHGALSSIIAAPLAPAPPPSPAFFAVSSCVAPCTHLRQHRASWSSLARPTPSPLLPRGSDVPEAAGCSPRHAVSRRRVARQEGTQAQPACCHRRPPRCRWGIQSCRHDAGRLRVRPPPRVPSSSDADERKLRVAVAPEARRSTSIGRAESVGRATDGKGTAVTAPQAAKAARTNNRKKKKKKPSSSTKSAVPAPSNTKTNKKKITTRQQNISTVISNEINQWARSDATFDVELENDFTEQEFVTWESGFKKQIAWRFKRTQVTAADHVASLGLGLRSDARDDLLIDEDARLCNVTDQRRLSRCHFEDLLRLQSGARLVLYLKTNSRSTNVCPSLVLKPFDGKLWDAAQLQRDASVGGDITTLAGKKYVVLKTTMLHARSHHDAVSGDVSLSQVQKRFFAKEGFTLKHDGTESTLTLSWQQVIALSEDLLIFRPPLDGTRQYRRCFKGKGESYCKRVYKNLAKETLGDVLTSSALTMAYQEKMIEFREKEIARLRLAKDVVAFNDTKHGERFFRVWDNMCRRRLTSAVTGFNDYNRPLIDLETVDDFVDTAARVFPSLWLHLCNLRGVDGNRHKCDSVNIQRRKRQVLLQLMVLKRMRNFRALKWWSVIQGIGYTG